MIEKTDTIVTGAGEVTEASTVDIERLAHARIDGPGVTLAYLAESKTYVRRLSITVFTPF